MAVFGAVAAIVVFLALNSRNSEPTRDAVKPDSKETVSTLVEPEPERITLAEVRAGFKDPQDYVKQLERELVKDRSGLEKFLYEPTEQEMEDLLRENLRETAVDSEDLENLLRHQMGYFRFSMKSRDNAAFVIPTHPRTVGKKRFVVVRKLLTDREESSTITEGDLKNKLNHELSHIADYQDGIIVNGVDLFKAVQQGAITKRFLMVVGEARAYHKQLEEILESRARGDETTFSQANMAVALFNYFRNVFLVLNPSNSYERSLGKDALAPCRSIKPEFTRNPDRSFVLSVSYTSSQGANITTSTTYDQNWNKSIPFIP